MGTVLTYDEAKAAVSVQATGLIGVVGANGIVQRSGDGVTYKTVRGLADVVLSSGSTPVVADHEFQPGVLNTYRSGHVHEIVENFSRTLSGTWGTAPTGQVWSGSNAAFTTSGFTGFITHASANTSFVNLLTTPTDIGDVDTYVDVSVSTSPTGAPLHGGIRLHRVDANNYWRVRLGFGIAAGVMTLDFESVIGGVGTVVASVDPGFTHSGGSTLPTMHVKVDGNRVRAKAWVPALTPEPTAWAIDVIVPPNLLLAAGAFGLESARDFGNTDTNPVVRFDDLLVLTGRPTFLSSATITPTLSRVWLESTMRSFLNVGPTVIEFAEPARSGRGDQVYVAGRTLPIAQTEVMTGRAGSWRIRVADLAAARRLEYLLASGDVLFVQVPADCSIPGGYYRVDQMSGRRVRPRGDARHVEVSLIEVAAPGPDVVTAQSTWDTVIALYGTWDAIVAAGVTWEDLLVLLGDPSEVIVP